MQTVHVATVSLDLHDLVNALAYLLAHVLSEFNLVRLHRGVERDVAEKEVVLCVLN